MKLFASSDDYRHVVELEQDERGFWKPGLCVQRDWKSRLRSAVPQDVAIADARSHVDPSEGRRR